MESSNVNEDKKVIIRASTFTLEFYKDGSLVKSFPIGLGKGGMGKVKEWDKKTPLGIYHILWKAHAHCDEEGGFPLSVGKSYCTPDNRFSENPENGAPIWGDSYGGDNGSFMCLNYPNMEDQSKGSTGSVIAIHGSLLGGIKEHSSDGCIRMYPKDAKELYRLVDVGTKVIIQID